MSTGIEFQIMMPMVNAPFRFYWAYNPMILRQYVTKPVVADRSYFPNEYTYAMAAAIVGRPLRFFEDRTTFRFTISRTF
jgi:outer membrane protein insertion porin family